MLIKCKKCGWELDEKRGDISIGIEIDTKWSELPNKFHCPKCKTEKSSISNWDRIDPLNEVRALATQPKNYEQWKDNIHKRYTLTGQLAVLSEARIQLTELKDWHIKHTIEEKTGEKFNAVNYFSHILTDVVRELEKVRVGTQMLLVRKINEDILQIDMKIKEERKMLEYERQLIRISYNQIPSKIIHIKDMKIDEFNEELFKEYVKYLQKTNKLCQFKEDMKLLRIAFLNKDHHKVREFSLKYSHFDCDFLIKEMNYYVGNQIKTNLRLYNLIYEFIIPLVEKEEQ